VTSGAFTAARPVAMDCSAPHQQVKPRTMPWTLFAIALIWLGNQLTCFLTTCEHGSSTAAAEEVGYAQPSVSEQIRSPEKSVGVQLFRRVGRGVVPPRSPTPRAAPPATR
jgi:Bacterial regulatory helix-turn-helix protein, lysR family